MLNQSATQPGSGSRGILKLIGHHQLIRSLVSAALQVLGCLVEHVFKIDAILGRQSRIPCLQNGCRDVKKHPVAILEGVCWHCIQTLMQQRIRQAIALCVADERAHQTRQLRRLQRFWPTVREFSIRVGSQHNAARGQFGCQALEVITVTQAV